MQRWEHMAVGQTDCGSYREAQEWVGKKAIESGDRGFELVGFDISRASMFSRRWHVTAIFKRPQH